MTAGQITLTSNGLPDVTAHLAAGTPGFTGGTGGWATTQRRKRKSLTEWEGVEPYAQEFNLEFGTRGGTEVYFDATVQDMVDRLERMASVAQGAPHPPIVQVNGFVRGTHLEWVIADEITWGAWEKTSSGVLVYQEASVRLLEYVPGQIVTSRSVKPRGPSYYTIHVSKRGDTLQKLALRYYGSTKYWRKIADAQQPKLSNGSKLLRPNTRLRIP